MLERASNGSLLIKLQDLKSGPDMPTTVFIIIRGKGYAILCESSVKAPELLLTVVNLSICLFVEKSSPAF